MAETSPLIQREEKTLLGPARLDRTLGWLHGHQRSILLAAVGFQFLVLAAMIVLRALPLLIGQTILLKVEPIDPRDLFRGDYVILNYDISRVPPGGIAGMTDSSSKWDDRPVYITLEPDADGKHWHAAKASFERPATGRFIRGKYSSGGWGRNPLKFGIEAYYVQEGKGLNLEKARNTGHLSAEVAVTPWGQAALRGLHVE